jgi:cytochrome c biogenesis protein CcdA
VPYLEVLLLGFIVGMKHALEADHVAAVATLATRSASLSERVKVASMWGVGHAGTLLLLGGGTLVLGLALPQRLARAFEGAAGVMLIVLGLHVLRRVRTRGIHFHRHHHGDGRAHFHAHAHDPSSADTRSGHGHEHADGLLSRALLVGTVHGLAGSAALVVLSLRLMPSTALALLYLAAFALGSVAGMAALSLAISVPVRLSSRYLGPAWRMIEGALGVVTIGLGCWMAASVLGGR